jgi:hypothetical protein
MPDHAPPPVTHGMFGSQPASIEHRV